MFTWSLIFIPCELTGKPHMVTDTTEFNTAVRSVGPGDIIILRNGVWNNAYLNLEAEGAPGKPVILRAETPGKTILTGHSRLRLTGNYLIAEGLYFRDGWLDSGHLISFRGSYNRLRQSVIENYNPPDRETRYHWVSLRNQHNVVEDNAFIGMNHSGVTVVVWRHNHTPNYHLIRRNLFVDRPRGTSNGWETIRIGTSDNSLSDSYTIVEENLFIRCNGEGEIISNKSGKNIYRYNTFVESQGTLTLRHGNGSLVEGNFFFGNHKTDTGGVRVIGEDHRVINNYFFELGGDRTRAAFTMMQGIVDSPLHGYYQVKRATVAFNTFINCRNPMVIGRPGSDTSLPPENCMIANNLLLSEGDTLINYWMEPNNFTYRGNIVWGGPAGIPLTDGLRSTDPGMVAVSDSLWRPNSDSPVIDAAAGSFDYVTEDVEGRLRGEKKDVGAQEISSSGLARRRPLTRDDVGPDWLRK